MRSINRDVKARLARPMFPLSIFLITFSQRTRCRDSKQRWHAIYLRLSNSSIRRKVPPVGLWGACYALIHLFLKVIAWFGFFICRNDLLFPCLCSFYRPTCRLPVFLCPNGRHA